MVGTTWGKKMSKRQRKLLKIAIHRLLLAVYLTV